MAIRSTSYVTIGTNPLPITAGAARNFSITNVGLADLLYGADQGAIPEVLIPAGMSQTFREVPYQKVFYFSVAAGTTTILFLSW